MLAIRPTIVAVHCVQTTNALRARSLLAVATRAFVGHSIKYFVVHWMETTMGVPYLKTHPMTNEPRMQGGYEEAYEKGLLLTV